MAESRAEIRESEIPYCNEYDYNHMVWLSPLSSLLLAFLVVQKLVQDSIHELGRL